MKTKGKVALSAKDNVRYENIHNTLADRRQQRVNTANAQTYTDEMKTAYQSYTSTMKNIRANLEAAKQGLAAIDEKGMSDKIIESIESIAEIRQKQMAATSAYSTQMAGFDSKRISYLKEHGSNKDRFIVEQFDEQIKQENAKLRIRVDELDHQYQDIEMDLYRDDSGKRKEPTDAEVLSAKREMDQILEEKNRVMEGYAMFMQKIAMERNEILHEWTEDTQPVEANPETVKKADNLETAFSDAEKTVHPKWEKFKANPVISHLSVMGAAIGRKLAPKFENLKSDLLAGYSAMKENNQMRKVEKTLSDLDKIQGFTGDGSHLSKFRASLESGKSVASVSSESDFEEIKVPEVVTETAPGPTESVTESELSELSPEQIRENRMKHAANKSVIASLDETGLRKIINDYYWSDISGTHDIATELQSSDNAMIDLNQYVNRIKGMIDHWPNALYRENMSQKLDAAMTETYARKSESERKVSAAESRIRDSEEFLRSLDMESDSGMPEFE